jgi:AraC-like DNA-binding protein
MGTLELAAVGFAGSGVGTALAIPMVWPRTVRPADVRFMGGWLLAGSAVVALISARVVGLLPATVALEHTINLIGFCAYPLLYLCIRAQSPVVSRMRDSWWLWSPAALYLLVLLIRAGLGGSTRVAFVWILPVLLALTAACALAVWRQPSPCVTAIVPARFIVAFLAALNVAQIVRMEFGHIASVRPLVPLVMTGGFVVLVGLVLGRALDVRLRGEPAGERAESPKYEKSGLEQEAALALLLGIERALGTERMFTDTHLTLGRLAAAIGSTPHQVSEALNRHASISFHELVNRHRVAEVKAQLQDPASDRFTIEGIGAAAGFGSRSALYAAFRRHEGMTPTEFRARMRATGTRDLARTR